MALLSAIKYDCWVKCGTFYRYARHRPFLRCWLARTPSRSSARGCVAGDATSDNIRAPLRAPAPVVLSARSARLRTPARRYYMLLQSVWEQEEVRLTKAQVQHPAAAAQSSRRPPAALYSACSTSFTVLCLGCSTTPLRRCSGCWPWSRLHTELLAAFPSFPLRGARWCRQAPIRAAGAGAGAGPAATAAAAAAAATRAARADARSRASGRVRRTPSAPSCARRTSQLSVATGGGRALAEAVARKTVRATDLWSPSGVGRSGRWRSSGRRRCGAGKPTWARSAIRAKRARPRSRRKKSRRGRSSSRRSTSRRRSSATSPRAARCRRSACCFGRPCVVGERAACACAGRP